jgi:uncharacterized protein
MNRWQKNSLRAIALLVVIAFVALALVSRSHAHELITNPVATRKYPTTTPADYNMRFEDVSVVSSDGLKLVAWYVPSTNGAALIVQHGYKDDRSVMLNVAALFHRHGYGVLINAVRAHDHSEGELISFGHHEMKDMNAFFAFLRGRPGVNPDRIGIFGISMGGSLAIQFAAENELVRAVVADCAPSSIADTVETSVRFFTGLPPFPFAPMILFWADREGGYSSSEINAKSWIGRISPRPVLLMQGGADNMASPESGERLFQAAREPKELWFDPELGHVQFLEKRPEEFERRVTGFFDRYLLAVK